MKLHPQVTFSELPLVRAIHILNKDVAMGRTGAPENRRSLRNDMPDEDWLDWLCINVQQTARADKVNGLSASFPWSPLAVYCMTQKMLKNPDTGAARVAAVSVAKGQMSCQERGCSGDLPVVTDHFFPSKHNGVNAITNLRLLCQGCNSKKRDSLDGIVNLPPDEPDNGTSGLFGGAAC